MRTRADQFRHDNFVDAMTFFAIMALILFAGCSHNTAPPKDGEWRVFWQQDSSFPRPIILEAHVPYDGAGPELTSYTPVTP